MIKNYYDYIIYGSGVPAISAAIKLKRQSAKVILLNRYGFCGGKIVEGLDLNLTDRPTTDSITKEIFDTMCKENYANISTSRSNFILNPELIRYSLLSILKQNNVDHIFNLIPISICKPKNFVTKFLGRDGEFVFESNNIIDASHSLGLVRLQHLEPIKQTKLLYNLIVSNSPSTFQLGVENIVSTHKLMHNRKYIKLSFDQTENNAKELHQRIYSLNNNLLNEGCRIQLLPIEPYKIYKIDFENLIGSTFFYSSTESFTKNDFEYSEELEMKGFGLC